MAEPEKASYVVQARNTPNGQWVDFYTIPVAEGQRARAETMARDMHASPPHHATRVIRRITNEWVLATYD